MNKVLLAQQHPFLYMLSMLFLPHTSKAGSCNKDPIAQETTNIYNLALCRVCQTLIYSESSWV